MPIIGEEETVTVTIAVAVPVAILNETQPAGTAAGSFGSGVWNTMTLNTEVSDLDSIVTLAANQFTLIPGRYNIQWSFPAFQVNAFQSRLYDVTGAAVVLDGSTSLSGAGDNQMPRSMGSAEVQITAANTYRIEGRCFTTKAANGRGAPANLGDPEVYAIVTIFKTG